jgi:hypothetical protein
MAAKNVKAPNLPLPPQEYDRQYMDKLLATLRLYFTQLDNVGPIAASTEINGTDIVAALSFFRPSPTVPNTFVLSLPTQADLANLRVGDVYYDTTAGNVLKIKT